LKRMRQYDQRRKKMKKRRFDVKSAYIPYDNIFAHIHHFPFLESMKIRNLFITYSQCTIYLTKGGKEFKQK
jgi:hypothetical protein